MHCNKLNVHNIKLEMYTTSWTTEQTNMYSLLQH